MPVKIFVPAPREDVTALEARVNEWMATLDQGAVRQISTAVAAPAPPTITIWYTQAEAKN
jgi:hypothetical protein